ncbi:MAG: DUF805 domain-containing protein [Pseudomonadota bacterium]
MNLTHILFSPNGRIGQNQYWVGVLILVLSNVFLTLIPLLGTLIWIALIYVGAVIAAKRLHDAGKSGWIHLIPWALSIVLVVIGFMVAGGAVLAAVMEVISQPGGWDALMDDALTPDEGATLFAGGIAGLGGLLLFFLLSWLVWLIYTIWVGVLDPEPGANRFGPAPVLDAAPAAPAASPAKADSDAGADGGSE